MQTSSVIRRVLAALSLALVCGAGHAGHAAAQAPAQGPPPAAKRPAAAPGVGEILGKLVDSASGRPVSGGSVAVRRANDSTFASGALPKADGSFHVDGLAAGRYTLRVRVIGFAPVVRNDIMVTKEKPVVDVGPIGLTQVAAKLDASRVVAEREEVVLAPDRNSYAVKNMTTASGGTAIDVLRNIPLVEVDGSNNVSLRGNANVVIQINGRSTPLKGDQLGAFLAQLPAGTVKNVEVATNPSAKDDPEGTAGIINIVLNQQAELGLSGGVSVGTASTGQVNTNGNVGKQQGKLTVYVSGSVYRDRRSTSGTISRTNLVLPVPAFTETRLQGNQAPLSGGGNLRTEYRFTERNSLSLDAFLYGGRYGGDNASDYTDFDATRAVIGLFDQRTSQLSRNMSQDYDLTFRRFTEKNLPRFSSELEYANNYNNNDVDLSGIVLQADPSTPAAIPTERDHTAGKYPYLNWKTDFTQQFGTTTKLESGLKVTQRTTSNDFTAAYLNPSTGVYSMVPSRTTSFDYHEDIGAGYLLLSNRIDKVQTQAGLRLENAATYLDLNTVGQRFDRRYASVYPSAIVSYNFTPLRQAKISYSRRVSRPNPYQLSPIEFRQDTRNVFRGNPGLRAEYTDAMELGYQESRSWGSVQLNPYLRRTLHAVRNIQFVDTTGVSVSTFDNVASTMTIGSDLNVNAHHGPLQLGGGGSLFHYSSDASNLSGNLSTHAMVWSARTNATWKFSPATDAQAFIFYRAPYATEGGSQLASVSMNFATRYKVWGEQGNVSLRVSDPFKLQKFGYRTANGTVVEYNQRFFGSRAVFLTITRNFGKAIKLQPKQQDPDAAAPPAPGTPP
ncbi:MAG: TonB-dependent receptor [Gemmatimonadetes bacterium]|nr:TonB-dependent receptor [Gemmatimonadota bacterium]